MVRKADTVSPVIPGPVTTARERSGPPVVEAGTEPKAGSRDRPDAAATLATVGRARDALRAVAGALATSTEPSSWVYSRARPD